MKPDRHISSCIAMTLAMTLIACAEGTLEDDELIDSDGSPLAAEDTPESEFDTLGLEKGCTPATGCGRLDPVAAAIEDKRSSLPEELRGAYFARSVDGVRTTPDGVAYRFFRGVLGQGAIYRVHGGIAIYGPILDEWERQGFEHGSLGYPIADLTRMPTTADSWWQEFTPEQVAATVENQGLTEIRRFLSTDGPNSRAAYHERRGYLVSNTRGTLSDQPQLCAYIEGYFWDPLWREISGDGLRTNLWCGPTPPEFDPNYVPPATGAAPEDI
jgi:hypothetical protein